MRGPIWEAAVTLSFLFDPLFISLISLVRSRSESSRVRLRSSRSFFWVLLSMACSFCVRFTHTHTHIHQDTSGYIRIHQDTQDTDVSKSVRVYLVRYPQDTSGYVRIRVGNTYSSIASRIRQNTFRSTALLSLRNASESNSAGRHVLQIVHLKGESQRRRPELDPCTMARDLPATSFVEWPMRVRSRYNPLDGAGLARRTTLRYNPLQPLPASRVVRGVLTTLSHRYHGTLYNILTYSIHCTVIQLTTIKVATGT